MKFTDASGTKNEGFLYYPPKPYLVITRGKDGTKLDVIPLPDLANPKRIKHKGGWGTIDFNFKTHNGMLGEFGQKADSKGPETITAVSSGLSSVVGAIPNALAMTDDRQRFYLSNPTIIDIADRLQSFVLDPLTNNVSFKGQIQTSLIPLRNAVQELRRWARREITGDVDLMESATQQREAIEKVISSLEPVESFIADLAKVQGITSSDMVEIVMAHSHLIDVLKDLRPLAAKQEGLEVYEIRPGQFGKLEFVRQRL